MAVALEVGWASGEIGNSFARVNKKRAWGDDQQKLLEMMLGKPFEEQATNTRHTLDLLGCGNNKIVQQHHQQQQKKGAEFLELGPDAPLPFGWEKRLDLKSGMVFFTHCNTGESTYDDPRKLQQQSKSCHISLDFLQSELCKQQKCAVEDVNNEVDLELNLFASTSSGPDQQWQQQNQQGQWLLDSSQQQQQQQQDDKMVLLTGCKRCLMYVMISQADPRCPKCGTWLAVDLPIAKRPRFDLEL